MRKSVGIKPYLAPMPVVLVASYDEAGQPDAMNAAYVSMRDDHSVSLYLSAGHKTVENILKKKAFTLNLADLSHQVDADYLGCVSAHDRPDKLSLTNYLPEACEKIDAPLLSGSPLILLCKLEAYDPKDGHMIGELVDVLVEEAYLDEDGQVDMESMDLIALNPAQGVYQVLGESVGSAFKSKELVEGMEEGAYEEPDPEELKKTVAQRTERVREMEAIMNQLSALQGKVNQALDEWEDFEDQAEAFDRYYSSYDWMTDYEADQLGLFPDDLARGVLNEDLPYDVLGETYYLARRMRDLSARLLHRS